MKLGQIKSLLVVLVFSIFITACDFGSKQVDPFENIQDKRIEVLSGELFPFSASITTTATHRLEKDGKLQAYLASRVFNLADFEGRKIEIEGFFKEEKMRPIFWVQSLKLLDAKVEIEESLETRFSTKNFTFLYPKSWNYTTAPNGTAYFTKKNDVSRRVFLTFSIDEISIEDKKERFNVLIANLNGVKKIEILKNSQEKETLILFSNTSNKKYTFIFTNNLDDFETKKSYFKLLQNFKEGANVVRQELEKEQAIRAQQELEILQKEKLAESLLEKVEDAKEKKEALLMLEKNEKKEDEGSIFSNFLGSNDETGNKSEIEEEVLESDKISENKNLGDLTIDKLTDLSRESVGEFKDLIDNRAYTYVSKGQNFSVKIPYGFWFVNYGKNIGLGVAKHPINSKRDVRIWLVQITDSSELREVLDDDDLIIYKNNFKISGKLSDRDVMYSILQSIK